MFWTIPLNTKEITIEQHLQGLQKYMMVSKPEIQEKEKEEKIEEKQTLKEDSVTPFHVESNCSILVNEMCKKEIKKMTPTHQDSFFWCLFIAKYGYKEYINIGSQHGRKELEEKTKIAEFVGEKKNKLSEDLDHKITNVFCQSMVTDLLTKPIMPLSSIYGFCCFYEMSFFIINEQEKTYLSFLYKKNPNPIYIFVSKNKYSILDNENIDLETYILVNHYEKPLRAISTYTKTDLEEIAEKIKFEIPEKMKKNELYYALWCKLAWNK